MEIELKKKIVKLLMENNILVDEGTLLKIEDPKTAGKFEKIISSKTKTNEEQIKEILNSKSKETTPNYNIKIIQSHSETFKKKSIQDFISHFNNRYKRMSGFLQKKQELQDATSIKRIMSKTEKEQVALIGLVYEIAKTKNGNILLTLEDPTGQINVIVHKSKQDAMDIAEEIVYDECIGIMGVFMRGAVFANSIILPDIPPTRELKKAPAEAYAVFAGDMHTGSKQFLGESFNRMISWLRGEIGTEEQKRVAEKTRYFFIVGDLVDGVGIYPKQYEDLEIKDIRQQYKRFAEDLKKIPGRIAIILCPGNHDAVRLSEPQPQLPKEFASELYEMPNVFMVSNPSIVNIESGENFQGLDVLLYHGMSFPYYAENVKNISKSGGLKRADLIMKFLLQCRHLAPAHTSTLYMPEGEEDPLVIEKIPDFFVTGHIHRATTAAYRNVTLLNCSSWIGMTEYQQKTGLVPEPSRIIAANLQTRETKIMRF